VNYLSWPRTIADRAAGVTIGITAFLGRNVLTAHADDGVVRIRALSLALAPLWWTDCASTPTRADDEQAHEGARNPVF
jgi:hypothetical protein